MKTIEENKLGNISISQDIIRSIIVDKTIASLGKEYLKNVFLTNSKGKKISRFNTSSGIKFHFNKRKSCSTEDVEIVVYMILKFGTSIKNTTDTIGRSIKNTGIQNKICNNRHRIQDNSQKRNRGNSNICY